MKKLLRISFVCVLVMSSSMALADGKFYTKDAIPPDLPYQRAVISYQDGQELLILQSKFEGQSKDLGWVIPLPQPPKIGTIKDDSEWQFFWWLSDTTGPNVSHYASIILLFFPFALILLLVMRIYYAIKKKTVPVFWQITIGHPKEPSPSFLYRNVSSTGMLLILLFLVMIAAVAIPNLATSRLGVDILSEQQIGIYDIKVVKASDSKDLIQWLNEHKYKFAKEDEAAFNSYIQKGWCFVTARINSGKPEETWFGVTEGLPDPLVFVFNAPQMVYPLALTATIGKETEIVLYVFGNHRTEADQRFKMEFADKVKMPEMKVSIESPDKIDMGSFPNSYLTKLRGRLSADQMRDDLILKPAPDDKPYEEHLWRW